MILSQKIYVVTLHYKISWVISVPLEFEVDLITHLDVVVWVPVRVVDDDGVGRVQVDAETSSTRGQQEAELFSAFLVEAIDGVLRSML
jgi:hypothetical protein